MQNFRNTRICFAILFVMTGCAGPSRPNVISTTGIPSYLAKQPDSPASLISGFVAAARAASPDGTKLGDEAAQKEYRDSGFALIYSQCNDYLASKASSQAKVNVLRDTFVPVTSLLTGVIALADGGKSIDHDILTALSLGTNAASAGFKIYEERFLFGARNSSAVRRLVLKALASNSEEAQRINVKSLTFRQATISLIENQYVCSPENILDLVSEAIAVVKVDSTEIKDSQPINPEPQPSDKIQHVTTRVVS